MDSWIVVHDSQDLQYRSPFGAVAVMTRVCLRLETDQKALWQSVQLRLWQDGTGETILPLTLSDSGFYEVSFTVERPGLIWYYFILEADNCRYYYGNNWELLGGKGQLLTEPPPAYQLTVYEQQTVPDWYKQGIMYQIFVDRFCRGGKQDGPYPPGALVHAHWDDTPMYTKDVQTTEIMAYDFFGGNLAGIREKLTYLYDLGITILYLNPIFESISNHKYDTGDYHQVDPQFGTKEEFTQLCREAEKLGIHIILDGVFSHTGSDSRYFNRYGRYDSIGAYQSPTSPYYSWFRFKEYPSDYESWWGIDTLPNVEEMNESYRDFIIRDQNSVIRSWLKAGAKGWRLDVVDELPPVFLQELRQAVKETDPEAIVLGEVWEDASRKESYGEKREYLLGKELDSTMNYPFRRITLDFLLGHISADDAHRRLMSLYENYPKEHFYSAMNLIDSHDVPRALSLLGDSAYTGEEPIAKLSRRALEPEERRLAKNRLKLLVLWQMTFPGVPCIYYGDEAGVEGYKDPLNRRTYPWGQADEELLSWYKKLTALRQNYPVFWQGDLTAKALGEQVYAYRRSDGVQQAIIVLNRGSQWETVLLPIEWTQLADFEDILFEEPILRSDSDQVILTLRPYSGKVLFYDESQAKEQKGEQGVRRAGVLLHPTSLPTEDLCGSLGKEAYDFIDFLQGASQSLWQILPLNPVGFGDSPYQCPSAFAGNPLLLDLSELAGEPWDYSQQPQELEAAKVWKLSALRKIYDKQKAAFSSDVASFSETNREWLEDYVLFTALSRRYGSPWSLWPQELKYREKVALAKAKAELAEEIHFERFLQYHFFRQWQALRRYAKKQGVVIVGDMPLYVAYDSADVWSRPDLFELDEALAPVAVAGVPPDYFSATGQLWGNPLYRWEKHEAEGFAWWRRRLGVLLDCVDLVRLDHFRGIEAYYSIPAGALTAEAGQWRKGPDAKLLQALQQGRDILPLVAEDLGYITEAVEELKQTFQLPGMKVLHFSFYKTEAGCAPITIPRHSFVYTGTHDNNTTRGWIQEMLAAAHEQSCLQGPFGSVNEETAAMKLIEFAYASKAVCAVIPAQDLLNLDSQFRMNQPGTVGGNWKYRLTEGDLTKELQQKLAKLTSRYKRNILLK
ncbi:MAG: 4-alpha-glucanotransferase [Sporomusaceae bacterium]|nr:4-alpha-glucanotransferase [Sporomusaceae bacterium]